MAPRKSRRSAAAAAPPPEPPQDEDSASALSEPERSPSPPSETHAQGPSNQLNFNDTLLGRPGRPIPVATLLKRLQSLADELKRLEQEESDDFKESCKPVAKELSDISILNHKDKGVRAFAAQCIVDLLALCAPDAPFSTQALKNSFELIIKSIFPALADPSHAYNAQHAYVLDSLAEVKSILLITDLPSANKLMTQLFMTFFDIFAGTSRASGGDEPVSKHVEFNMLQILVTLIDEAESLPQDVVDIIVAQFLRADPKLFGRKEEKSKKGEKSDEKQATLTRKELPTAYMAAKRICDMVTEKMAREISKYFSDVIMEASGANADGSRRKSSGDVDEIDESTSGPSEEDMNDLRKAHRLVRELWRACPAVLPSVVPQLEAELSVENVQLRMLAAETLGDMISGIGAAGAPTQPPLDPAAYPPLSLAKAAAQVPYDPLTTPASPQSFPQTHPQTYSAFLGRRQDKSALVRSAWTSAIGRILSTNAGGVGLNHNEEKRLVEDMGRMMNDSDEKVRLAAVKAVQAFSCHDAVNKLSITGGIDQEGSAFNNLGQRVKDKRHIVRAEAVRTLARFWAAAHGEIAENNEPVIEAIGNSPGFILDGWYVNNLELQELIESVVFETLLPMNYPPIKTKKDKSTGASQRPKDIHAITEDGELDPDMIRAERMLVFANSLDERAQKVFLALSQRQVGFARYVMSYLAACEEYNGGVMDSDESAKEKRLTSLIDAISKMFEDRQRVHADLWKFAKVHDRRNYQLIRFCTEAQNDYKTVKNSIRELKKRMTESSNPTLLETLTPILYRSSLILYNRSHVPAILKFAKTNEKGLAAISNLLLKEISERSPAVLETHIQEMCQSLQDAPPSAGKPNGLSVLDNLKACAAFARGYPHKLPKDRKFLQSLTSYTLYGSPPEAGKHAVSIILGASDKKPAAAKDILRKCLKGFKYGEEGFLTRLAAISQVMQMAPEEANEFQNEVFTIVMDDILTKVRSTSTDQGYVWSTDIDEECSAKMWAIKVVVNRVRSYPDSDTLKEVADPILATLGYIIANEGDLSPGKDTPPTHKPQLRLLAAHSLLKLCRSKRLDDLVDGLLFVKLAEVAQDSILEVRSAFLKRLRKYMDRGNLQTRFLTIPCLLAYEPDQALKFEMITWLKAKTRQVQQQTSSSLANGKSPRGRSQTVMEATCVRLISLLAHHTDYDESPHGLLEVSQYIIFYLNSVATAENISLIYHLAQRVKAHRDATAESSSSIFAQRVKSSLADTDFDYRLHTLSDLACATIRAFVEAQSWNLQTLPSRATLPRPLYREIKDHDEAITIAEKDFLADVVIDDLDSLVRQALRKKPKAEARKRKSEAILADDDDESGHAKRAKRSSIGKVKGEKTPRSATKKQKTPKRRRDDWGSGTDEDDSRLPRDAATEKSRRKSGRKSDAIHYEEGDSDDDEMEGVAVWEYENGTLLKDGAGEEDDSEDEDEDEDEDGHDEDVEQEDEAEELELAKPASKPKSRASKKAEDEDVDMTDDLAVNENESTSSPPSPISSSPATKRGKATPKAKAAKEKATPASKPSATKSASKASTRAGRSGGGAAKTTKSSPNADDPKALPTRSGRATRSGR